MSPQASRRQVVTKPANTSDVETARKLKPHHHRSQKFCSTDCLPALFAWLLLLITSFSYWLCILPELIDLLPTFLPILILHCLLFVLLCGNFILATFMDPVGDDLGFGHEKKDFLVVIVYRVCTNNR